MSIAATKTSGVTSIISDTIGKKRESSFSNMKAFQQLLIAAGFPCEENGKWNPSTEKAFADFQNKIGRRSLVDYINPSDQGNLLLKLAEKTGATFKLPGSKGVNAGITLSNSLVNENKVIYARDWDRPIWGVKGHLYAIMTRKGRYLSGPLQLDCTTYANLMISIIRHGTLENSEYNASLSGIGGTAKQLWHRYDLRHVKNVGEKDEAAFYGADAARKMVEAVTPGAYLIGVAKLAQGGVGHYAIMIKQDSGVCLALHANVGVKNSGKGGIYHEKLESFAAERLKKREFFYCFGPI